MKKIIPTVILIIVIAIAGGVYYLLTNLDALIEAAIEKYGLAYCKRAGELAFKGGGTDSSPRIGTPVKFRELLIAMARSVST